MVDFKTQTEKNKKSKRFVSIHFNCFRCCDEYEYEWDWRSGEIMTKHKNPSASIQIFSKYERAKMNEKKKNNSNNNNENHTEYNRTAYIVLSSLNEMQRMCFQNEMNYNNKTKRKRSNDNGNRNGSNFATKLKPIW